MTRTGTPSRTAQIVDTIGMRSNMDSNNHGMARALALGGWEPCVVSNYLDRDYANPRGLALPDFYRGRSWDSVRLLLQAALAFARYVRAVDHPGTLWLLHNSGLRLTDVLFLGLLWRRRRRTVLVIHDVLSVRSREPKPLVALKAWIYRRVPAGLVVHSSTAAERLHGLGYRGPITEVELFRTVVAPVAPDRAEAVADSLAPVLADRGRLRILLFGSIRRTKGTDTALAALRALTPEQRQRCLLIIAGRDGEGLLGTPGHEIPDDGSVVVMDRFISNEERAALYTGVDFLLLPYREVYQSGILEQAVAHRARVLASSIPSFAQFFAAYPSFGATYGSDAEALRAAILGALAGRLPGGNDPYTDDDMARYESQDPLRTFAPGLQAMLQASGNPLAR